MLPALRDEGFRRCFESKGRFSEALRGVPTLAVVHPHAGLLGAAACAVQSAPMR
jgi:glucokinase